MSEQRETDLARCWREKQAGFAAAADMIGRLLDEWEAGRVEIDALRAVLIEAQECIDYGTRAGGAAEVLAHIATVLKGDEHATVLKAGDESWQARRAELLNGMTDENREQLAAALDRAFEFGRGMR